MLKNIMRTEKHILATKTDIHVLESEHVTYAHNGEWIVMSVWIDIEQRKKSHEIVQTKELRKRDKGPRNSYRVLVPEWKYRVEANDFVT